MPRLDLSRGGSENAPGRRKRLRSRQRMVLALVQVTVRSDLKLWLGCNENEEEEDKSRATFPPPIPHASFISPIGATGAFTSSRLHSVHSASFTYSTTIVRQSSRSRADISVRQKIKWTNLAQFGHYPKSPYSKMPAPTLTSLTRTSHPPYTLHHRLWLS